jgi:hypothetical protein
MRIATLVVAAAVTVSGLAVTTASAQAAPTATPQPTIDVTVSRSTLYSTVRDGYRDWTYVDADMNGIDYSSTWHQATDEALTISDESGTVVYTEGGWMGDDGGQWTWDGNHSTGARLPVGTYTLTVTADFDNLVTPWQTVTVASDPVTVQIKRETYIERKTVSRRGDRPNTKSKQGRGGFYRGIYSHSYVADSWGGTLTLRYRVTVPKRGFNVKIRRYVYWGDSHMSKGRVRDKVTKVSPRTWLLTVTASNWGAAEVDGFEATYSVRRVR